jgi:uncharacterized membrane protein
MAPYLIVTILAFASLNVMYKVSHVRKCESWVFLGGLYAVGAASSAFGLVSQKTGFHIPAVIWVMGIGAGAMGVTCLLCLLRALKLGGKLSLVTVISQMSLSVPILYAMLVMGEKLTAMRVVGLLLFVVFVILLNEPAGAKSEEAS